MSVSKKVLLNAAATMVLAGAAHAAVITSPSVGAETLSGTATYALATEAAFTSNAPTGTITLPIEIETGNLPSGNILLNVSLTNALFDGTVAGTAVDATGCSGTGTVSAVISSGGTTATGSVTFVLSGAQICGDGDLIEVELPIRATGAGNIAATAGFTTEGGVPVDGAAKTRNLVSLVSAFEPVVVADTTASTLTLASGFKAFSGNNVLGGVGVRLRPNTFRDLSGSNLAVDTDVASIAVTVSGDFSGFGTATGSASLQVGGAAATISGSSASITLTGTAASTAVTTGTSGATGLASVTIVPSVAPTAVVLNASAYSASVTGTFVTGSSYSTATESASGALGSVVRQGTTILLPWTSSQTNAAVTGSNNIVRIGNRTNAPIAGVFARVVNSSASGFANSSLVPLGVTIPAGGELLLTSETLQAALGDFARGDIEVVIEAESSALSVRRLVARPDGVFDFGSGAQ